MASRPSAPQPQPINGRTFAELLAPLMQVARPTAAQVGAPIHSPAPMTAAATAMAPLPPMGASAGWVQRLPVHGRQWTSQIDTAARNANVDPALLAALVWQESNFRADAVSPSGAIGLGQLMPGTADSLGVNPRDAADNLNGAARYLRTQMDRFGSVELGLAAYNAGPGAVAKAGGVPPFAETRQYIPSVMTRYGRLRGTEST